jgi:hypothetical protein
LLWITGDYWSYSAAMLVTMVICGLWHGASGGFVVWGALHGAALAVHRLAVVTKRFRRLPRVIGWLLTVSFVTLAWVPFRAGSLKTAWVFLGRLVAWNSGGAVWWPEAFLWVLAPILVGHLIGWIIEHRTVDAPSRRWLERTLGVGGATLRQDEVCGWHVRLGMGSAVGAFVVVLWAIIVFYLGPPETSPFVYARF